MSMMVMLLIFFQSIFTIDSTESYIILSMVLEAGE